MRFLGHGALAALATLVLANTEAMALDVFATSFFPVESPADPDPTLTGVLKINVETGSVSTFIPESPQTGFIYPTDVVVDSGTNRMYVSTLSGLIFHFDALTGAPLESNIPGLPGAFAALPQAEVEQGNGYNNLLLTGDGQVLVATAFGSITPYELATGAPATNLADGLPYPSGMAYSPAGDLLVSVGDPFGGPGAVLQLGAEDPLVPFGATPGVRGGSKPFVVYAAADYNRDGVVNEPDYDVWAAAYGTDDPAADGNFDGVVDAADYTVWRDAEGEEATIVITDLNGNQLTQYTMDGSFGMELAIIPPAIPDPLPDTANEAAPSNSPSGLLETPDGTFLVSTLGLTRRPDNRGALIEFGRDGGLLGTIVEGLPPISAIAFAPESVGVASVPEPSVVVLAAIAMVGAFANRRV
ncbi:hypothetical protein [Botrimarina mediterranea]|uniref:hypothetical protein n=1 Tax=Botrimarina mediterranea TaxID=2528022 RepID=UPI00118A1B21|nr:hypothetical protein K2D_46230 [Planctomycetes bacterium K2D]